MIYQSYCSSSKNLHTDLALHPRNMVELMMEKTDAAEPDTAAYVALGC